MRHSAVSLIVLAVLAVLVACGGDSGTGPAPGGGGGGGGAAGKPVAFVKVTPASPSAEAGATQQFTAAVEDADHAALTGRTVTWASSKPAVATIDASTGLATAVAAGTATITATSEGKNGTASLTVTAAVVPVASVTVTPPTASVIAGQTIALAATTKDAGGTVLTGRAVAWTTDHPEFATVSTTGVVTGVAAGTATITATSEGKAGTATVTVTAVTQVHSYSSISTTFRSSCDLDESGQAWCWGAAYAGELGTGTATDNFNNDSHVPAQVVGGHHFNTLTAHGDASVCGVADAKVWCWGPGHVTATSLDGYSTSPLAMAPSLNFASVSAGDGHACALTADGAAYCWGYNPFGELGNGTSAGAISQPVAVSGGLTFAMISAGGNFTCGVTTSAAAYCWGLNTVGQLGNGTKVNASTPVAVAGGEAWRTISVGSSHTCGINTAGVAFCWGNNSLGGNEWLLGVGSHTNEVLVPTAVMGGHTFSSISAGQFTSCAVTTSGEAWCWGYDSNGQLGHANSTYYSDTPLRAGGSILFAEISTHGHHTCGIAADRHTVYCWGENVFGQSGDGTAVNDGQHHPEPVIVSGQAP